MFRPLVLVPWSRVLQLFLIAGWLRSIFTLRNLRPFNSIVVENPNIPNYSFKFICSGPSPLFAEVLKNSTLGDIILKLSTQFIITPCYYAQILFLRVLQGNTFLDLHKLILSWQGCFIIQQCLLTITSYLFTNKWSEYCVANLNIFDLL